MGTLTESELKDEVKRALGNRDDMDSRLVRFLNLAQIKMARTHEFEELQTVTDDTLGYTGVAADDKFLDVATTIKNIYSFRIFDSAQSRKLEYIPSRQWDKKIPLPEYYATGWPSSYTKWRHKLEFWQFYRTAMNSAVGDDIVAPDMTIAPDVGGGLDGKVLGSYWSDPFVGSMP